jgi:hypothetical protein
MFFPLFTDVRAKSTYAVPACGFEIEFERTSHAKEPEVVLKCFARNPYNFCRLVEIQFKFNSLDNLELTCSLSVP